MLKFQPHFEYTFDIKNDVIKINEINLDSLVAARVQYIIDLKEYVIRTALIKAGWTPPINENKEE